MTKRINKLSNGEISISEVAPRTVIVGRGSVTDVAIERRPLDDATDQRGDAQRIPVRAGRGLGPGHHFTFHQVKHTKWIFLPDYDSGFPIHSLMIQSQLTQGVGASVFIISVSLRLTCFLLL